MKCSSCYFQNNIPYLSSRKKLVFIPHLNPGICRMNAVKRSMQDDGRSLNLKGNPETSRDNLIWIPENPESFLKLTYSQN